MSEVAFDHAVLRLYDVCGLTSAGTSICQSKRYNEERLWPLNVSRNVTFFSADDGLTSRTKWYHQTLSRMKRLGTNFHTQEYTSTTYSQDIHVLGPSVKKDYLW